MSRKKTMAIACIIVLALSFCVGIYVSKTYQKKEETFNTRQGVMISAPEEIAYVRGWINKEQLLESAERYGKSPYGQHLKAVADGKHMYEKN